jgi:hypothetical protein
VTAIHGTAARGVPAEMHDATAGVAIVMAKYSASLPFNIGMRLQARIWRQLVSRSGENAVELRVEPVTISWYVT